MYVHIWLHLYFLSFTCQNTCLVACYYIKSYLIIYCLLLCRSSLHGKGLNRFWSKVEGYHGPLLILVSAVSKNDHGGDASARKWIIGALTDQGFENRDAFYGSAGNLYSISPVFHAFLPSGMLKGIFGIFSFSGLMS